MQHFSLQLTAFLGYALFDRCAVKNILEQIKPRSVRTTHSLLYIKIF